MNNETAKKNKTNEVAVQKGGAVAAYDYSQFAGQGFESHTKDDYATPFLGVLQSNSPLLNEKADAKAGMLVNTVTQNVYDGKNGGVFVPSYTDHVVVEWKPRDQGGGFVAIHQLNDELVKKVEAEQEFGKYKTVKGDLKSNDLIETFYVYGIFIDDEGNSEQMIIAFSSTKIKAYKRWMTKARTVQVLQSNGARINPPLFAHKYRINTVSEKNQKGSYFNFNIDFDGGSADKCRLAPTDPLFQAALSFFQFAKEGKVKAAHESQVASAGSEPEEAEVPFK